MGINVRRCQRRGSEDADFTRSHVNDLDALVGNRVIGLNRVCDFHSVRRPRRIRLHLLVICQLQDPSAVAVSDVEVWSAVAIGDEGEPGAVSRPTRENVQEIIVSDDYAIQTIGCYGIDTENVIKDSKIPSERVGLGEPDLEEDVSSGDGVQRYGWGR